MKLFDGKDVAYQDFKDEFRQMPMFQEKKLLVLSNIFQNQEFTGHFLENGQTLANSKDLILIREAGQVSPKDDLFKFLLKSAKTQEFQNLNGIKLRNWAKKEFEKYQAKIQPEALGRLAYYVGNDLWQFSQEIQKLAAFKRDGTIAAGDIDLLVKPEIETDIFRTIEAMALRDKKGAIRLVHEHLEKGDNPLYILSMINFQFRNLLIVKKTGRLNGHPYFVRKTIWLAGHFSLDELRALYHSILEADIKIKTGRLDPQTALDLLVTGI